MGMREARAAGGAVKIATCCYCGARTALELGGGRGQAVRALRCASCAAPLTKFKRIKRDVEAPVAHAPGPSQPARRRGPPPRSKPKKRRSPPLLRRMADFVEDVFDELEDLLD